MKVEYDSETLAFRPPFADVLKVADTRRDSEDGWKSPTIDPVGQSTPSPSSSSPEEEEGVSDLSASSSIGSECVVCGDKASGKHYGQYSCEGCKSFFKRSIRRSLSYSCRGNKSCPVDIHHRNQCQFCRLKKCVKMGMRKEGTPAVQRGRLASSLPSALPPFFFLPFGANPAAAAAQAVALRLVSGFPPVPQPPPAVPEKSAISSYVPPLIAHLIAAEPAPKMQQLHSSIGLDNLFELGAQLLITTVEWCRRLTFFTELKHSDQTMLLRSSWAQLFSIAAAQAGLPAHSAPLLAATGMHHSPLHGEKTLALMDDIRTFQTQVERLKALRMDAAEACTLKALALFSSDLCGLSEAARVEATQEKVSAAFDDYCRLNPNMQPGRFGRLLLRLSALQTVSSSLIEQLFFSRLVGEAHIDVLLKDMLFSPTQSLLWPPAPPTSTFSLLSNTN